jgi:hypothetical protein
MAAGKILSTHPAIEPLKEAQAGLELLDKLYDKFHTNIQLYKDRHGPNSEAYLKKKEVVDDLFSAISSVRAAIDPAVQICQLMDDLKEAISYGATIQEISEFVNEKSWKS